MHHHECGCTTSLTTTHIDTAIQEHAGLWFLLENSAVMANLLGTDKLAERWMSIGLTDFISKQDKLRGTLHSLAFPTEGLLNWKRIFTFVTAWVRLVAFIIWKSIGVPSLVVIWRKNLEKHAKIHSLICSGALSFWDSPNCVTSHWVSQQNLCMHKLCCCKCTVWQVFLHNDGMMLQHFGCRTFCHDKTGKIAWKLVPEANFLGIWVFSHINNTWQGIQWLHFTILKMWPFHLMCFNPPLQRKETMFKDCADLNKLRKSLPGKKIKSSPFLARNQVAWKHSNPFDC